MGHNVISHHHDFHEHLQDNHEKHTSNDHSEDSPFDFIYSGIAHTGDESTYEKSENSEQHSLLKQTHGNHDFVLTDYYWRPKEKDFVYFPKIENKQFTIFSIPQSSDFLRGPPSPYI
ncbi:hypothetical protein OZ666_11085 [Elizabethkingia sp. HX QKY]|uniref:hypothetical protein n=1 Tax=Elizabethkingia TaxID=308865 RepID=UPI002A245A66|nr:hypothetical protein [Elizabethkingia sp. HX QKY]MDX8572227.1 hypothetical protein [Elizabethkingia sp. HX QKY]